MRVVIPIQDMEEALNESIKKFLYEKYGLFSNDSDITRIEIEGDTFQVSFEEKVEKRLAQEQIRDKAESYYQSIRKEKET